MTEELRKRLDECLVGMATKGQLTDQFLPPRLWEELRIRLQRIYRNATGEPMATLSIDHGGRADD